MGGVEQGAPTPMTENRGGHRRPGSTAPAELGALAHLYRGEMYRSTVWRTRLDTTTNWAVVTTGIALSVTFSSVQATPLPIVLVSLLLAAFLLFRGSPLSIFDKVLDENIMEVALDLQQPRRQPDA